MRLATRLTILLVGLTTAVAALVGWYSVDTSTRASYAALDQSINAVVAAGAGHPLTALSSALSVVQENNYDLTLDIVSQRGVVTQIVAGDTPLTRTPTLADVVHSLKRVSTSPGLAGFRFRSMSVGGGDSLLVAASTDVVAHQNHQLLVRTLVAGAIAAALLGVVARLVVQRDLKTVDRLIGYAGEVARGQFDHVVPAPGGSRDFRELQSSLSHMVSSLQQTIEAEQRLALVTQQFIGDASHELRTPLTVVRGYVELLGRADISDEQRRRAIDRVTTEVKRMDRLVNDLLFLAEVNEVPNFEVVPIELSPLVAGAARDFATDQPARSVTTDVTPDVVVDGRPDYFERLLANALSNVARHTGAADPVRVTLGGDARRVRLVVEDGGPGLPDGDYGAAPTRFHRFDDARSRATGGSGLGLSIMADVTSALGGTMTTAPSELGGVALTFSFARAAAPPT
ncbi:MAG: sensor histidine kinase [Acidimicrobiales bacterium]